MSRFARILHIYGTQVLLLQYYDFELRCHAVEVITQVDDVREVEVYAFLTQKESNHFVREYSLEDAKEFVDSILMQLN